MALELVGESHCVHPDLEVGGWGGVHDVDLGYEGGAHHDEVEVGSLEVRNGH